MWHSLPLGVSSVTQPPCLPLPPVVPPGIRPSNLRDAAPFEEVQREVADLLKGRIVVGHAIENDLEVRRGRGCWACCGWAEQVLRHAARCVWWAAGYG